MKVGVMGAGTMGTGIAQVFAQSGTHKVLLCDLNLELARKGKDKIARNLKDRVEKGKIKREEAMEILSAISVGVAEDCTDCNLIIEAAVENMEIKRSTFQKLQSICSGDCIFATNTSSLSVTEIGAGINRTVVGLHFFNPAPVMKLVEIIPALDTPSQTIAELKKIVETIGKVPVQIEESPGFAVNRILIPMINEAVGILAEGAAKAEDIDTAMKLGANHPMGPLELGDLIGLDIVLDIMEVLQKETGDSKYRPHPYLRKMVRGKKLGRKTGEGFYIYEK